MVIFLLDSQSIHILPRQPIDRRMKQIEAETNWYMSIAWYGIVVTRVCQAEFGFFLVKHHLIFTKSGDVWDKSQTYFRAASMTFSGISMFSSPIFASCWCVMSKCRRRCEKWVLVKNKDDHSEHFKLKNWHMVANHLGLVKTANRPWGCILWKLTSRNVSKLCEDSR